MQANHPNAANAAGPRMRSVEIFAGAAGLGLGMAKAGFDHEIVVENDSDACETIRMNQANGHPLVQGWNVAEASIEDCDLSAIKGDVDLVSGGPPCQGFSIGGAHKGHRDERNLWPWAIATVATLKPRAFVFENVPNLASAHAEYLRYLEKALTLPTIASPADWTEDCERLDKILATGQSFDPSYRVRTDVHIASDYGTGQKRKRLFIVGIRSDVSGEYLPPEATHSEYELMESKWLTGEYWDRHGLVRPLPDKAGQRWLAKHNRMPRDLFAPRLQAWNTVRDIFAGIPNDAPNRDEAPREFRTYKGHTGSDADDPAKTHRAGDHGVSGGEMGVTSDKEGGQMHRHYSVREAAALSDFPHDYAFSGSWGDGLRQIGNAVPCNLGEAVGNSIHQALAA